MATTSLTATADVAEYPFKLPFVITASAAGTIIEWYDFYLYGVLAAFFSAQFFPQGNDTAALLASLATFGAGFAVRPFGAAFFGRIGDLIGRKYTFLLTITVMGLSTALVGVLPDVRPDRHPGADHPGHPPPRPGPCPRRRVRRRRDLRRRARSDDKRGQNTSWIQTTATLGLLLALVIIGITRASMSRRGLHELRLADPVPALGRPRRRRAVIRLRLQETPLFSALKATGKSSTSPWRDSFGDSRNRRLILLVLLGATAGQAVVWYQGQFQALFFLARTSASGIRTPT